jgi:hypothetical protein
LPEWKRTTESWPEEKPFLDKRAEPLPDEPFEEGAHAGNGLSHKSEHSGTMGALPPVTEPASHPFADSMVNEPEQDASTVSRWRPVEIDPWERLAIDADGELGASGGSVSRSGDDLQPMERGVIGSESVSGPAPLAQPFLFDPDTDRPRQRVPVPEIAPEPRITMAEEVWQTDESPTSSIRDDRWPPLLPDRQPDEALTPRSLWNESEYRRRLLNEQRGV